MTRARGVYAAVLSVSLLSAGVALSQAQQPQQPQPQQPAQQQPQQPGQQQPGQQQPGQQQPQQPGQQPQQAQQPQMPMSFFVTSVGSGNGGNLGGLEGADKHCQQLASAAGAGNRTWRAYLSTTAAGTQPNINARDRIGSGPWYNARGQLIASNVDDLHEDRNNIRKPTALNEKGGEVSGVGDQPNQHDILTGSDSQGRAVPGTPMVTTCNNWTSNDNAHRAIVGHHDRLGGPNASWNAVHSSGGCSQEALIKTGGAGFFYCFAAD